jgi:DNA topoisomerase IB
VHDVGSAEVNEYLGEIAGEDITAKDFRTWAATLEAARLFALAAGQAQPRTKARVAAIVATIADHLGNTPAICRKCYIHPALAEAPRRRGARLQGPRKPCGAGGVAQVSQKENVEGSETKDQGLMTKDH